RSEKTRRTLVGRVSFPEQRKITPGVLNRIQSKPIFPAEQDSVAKLHLQLSRMHRVLTMQAITIINLSAPGGVLYGCRANRGCLIPIP
ncbi:MAG TPA: hypothetical protein VMT22_16385, partial [Terriglobales bacterium]|nr:hypothetical protein [Terriglobales bacterium]